MCATRSNVSQPPNVSTLPKNVFSDFCFTYKRIRLFIYAETNLLCIVSYYFIYPKSLHRVHRFDSVFIIFAPLLPFKKHGEEYVARTGRCFFSLMEGLIPVAESVYIIYETLHRRLRRNMSDFLNFAKTKRVRSDNIAKNIPHVFPELYALIFFYCITVCFSQSVIHNLFELGLFWLNTLELIIQATWSITTTGGTKCPEGITSTVVRFFWHKLFIKVFSIKFWKILKTPRVVSMCCTGSSHRFWIWLTFSNIWYWVLL